MLDKVRNYIRKEELLRPGSRVIVGLSGGADSVCLFALLNRLAPELGLSLLAVHVHHGIRGEEADGDMAFVRELCRKEKVPCRCIFRDIPAEAKALGLGLEEAGRLARREEFARALAETEADAIALAHHRNDLAETMLFQLARGSGLDGLTGISPKNGPYVRPLLCLTRAEIEAGLRERGLPWREDSTNADTAYARNLIRREILPRLEAGVNTAAAAHMAEAAGELREIREYLESLLPEKWMRCAAVRPSAVLLLEEPFLAEPPVFRRLLVREAFRRLGGLKDLGRVHVEAVLDLMEGAEGRRRDLPAIRALRRREGVLLEALLAGKAPGGRVPDGAEAGRAPGQALSAGREEAAGVPLLVPGETLFGGLRILAELLPGPSMGGELPPEVFAPKDGGMTPEICAPKGGELPTIIPKTGKMENHYTKCVDYAKIKGTLYVRFRAPGDYMVIHPDGRRKKLSDLFTDRKLPREIRDRVVLLAAGPEIIWAPGVRGGESARIGAGTGQVLRLTAEPAEARKNAFVIQ